MLRATAALIVVLSVGLSAQSAVRKDLEPLLGTWVLTNVSTRAIPAGAHVGFVFTGDKYQGLMNGKVNEAGTIKLDSTTKPASIDLVITEGTSAGKTQLGLVEFKGNQMTLALAEPGSTVRPASMAQEALTLTKLEPLPKALEGSWDGGINLSRGGTLRIAVKLANGPDGLGSGTLISVDQPGQEAPITAVAVTGSRVKFLVPSVRGTFDGELKDGSLSGTWSQGPGTTTMVLKRVQ